MYVFPASHLDVHAAIEPGSKVFLRIKFALSGAHFARGGVWPAWQSCQEVEISAEKHKKCRKIF
jgi:hypothetical protein